MGIEDRIQLFLSWATLVIALVVFAVSILNVLISLPGMLMDYFGPDSVDLLPFLYAFFAYLFWMMADGWYQSVREENDEG